jgi:Transglutaminase-like superfamily
MEVTVKSCDRVSSPAPQKAFRANSPLVTQASTSQRKSRVADAFLLLRVFAFAAAVPYLLRLKLPRVAGLVEPGTAPLAADPDRLKKIAAYVETAIQRGRPWVRKGCLTRGLTRYFFLRRAGLDVSLHFGMGRVNGEFVGHCWLVKDGQPFLEKEDTSPYFQTYRISIKGGEAVVPGGTVDLGELRNS